ncbi:MAG: hypothetical protein K8L99_25160 [Anaerolineae bacterium]|nr:hypothetical protein [Anaerolineae bacterium]
MRIERQVRRSNLSLPMLACGCLTVLLGGGIILVLAGLVFLPGIILQFTGFQSQGSTEAIFETITPEPTVVVENPQPTPAGAVVNLGQYGTETLNNRLYDYTIVTGSTSSGQQLATLTFDENSLETICQQRSDICGPNNPRFRNAVIDLKPGGAIVNGEVYVQQVGIWQRVGIVMRLTNNQLTIAGVDVGGTLYTVPPNEFSDLISEVERVGNEAIQQLAVEAGGTSYTLVQIQVTETALTLVMQ